MEMHYVSCADLCPVQQIRMAFIDQEKKWECFRMGVGAHEDATVAELIAEAEAAERLAIFPSSIPDAVLFGRRRDIAHAVDPAEFFHLTATQLERKYLAPLDDKNRCYWVPVREVMTGTSAYMAADICYAGLSPRKREYQRVAWANSSGVAAHTALPAARQAAVLELFERDSLMNMWMNRHLPPQIGEALPVNAKNQIAGIEDAGYQVSVLDITCRNVPVALALALRYRPPAVIAGAAARCSLEEAATAAMNELEVNVVCRLREWRARKNSVRKVEAKQVRGPADHAEFYCHPSNSTHCDWLRFGNVGEHRVLNETCWQQESVEFDLQAFCKRQGLSRVYELNYGKVAGFHVVRLSTPNLVPILFGFDQFPLTHPARVGDGPGWDCPIPPHILD